MRKRTLLVGAFLLPFAAWAVAATANQLSANKNRPLTGGLGGARTAAGPPQIALKDVSTNSFAPNQLSEAEYQSEMVRLDASVRAKDLTGLTSVADHVETTWGRVGGEKYGLLMLKVSNVIANHFNDYQLSQKYAAQALAQAGTFSLGLETRLLRFLSRDLMSGICRQRCTN